MIWSKPSLACERHLAVNLVCFFPSVKTADEADDQAMMSSNMKGVGTGSIASQLSAISTVDCKVLLVNKKDPSTAPWSQRKLAKGCRVTVSRPREVTNIMYCIKLAEAVGRGGRICMSALMMFL